MTNDRIKEIGIQGEKKEKRKISKGEAIELDKRQEMDWIKDRKTRRRKTE